MHTDKGHSHTRRHTLFSRHNKRSDDAHMYFFLSPFGCICFRFGLQALHLASQLAFTPALRLLHRGGSDLAAKDAQSRTALHILARFTADRPNDTRELARGSALWGYWEVGRGGSGSDGGL